MTSDQQQASADNRFDVVVVGGGAVGLSAALAFARAGRRTALVSIDGARRDGRTVALMQRSVRFLDSIGVWSALEPLSAPLERLCIIDDTGSLFRPPPVTFKASEIGLEAFGFNIESATLVERLAEMVATSSIHSVTGTVTDVTETGDAVQVHVADGPTLEAALVVAADGRRSRLRERLGIPVREWSYPQVAVTAIFAHRKDHDFVSTEFHTRHGPFTLVPLPGHRSSLVWLTSPEQGDRLAAMDDASFAVAVEKQAQSMLGAMRLDGPRGLVPMGGLSVSRFSEGRVALAGEAAHVFPPIGAQGLNLGLRDIADLIESVEQSASRSRDFARHIPGALAAFETSRRSDVATRTNVVDTLNRSLLTPFLPLDFARGAGLLALGSIAPLRRMVMKQGLGR